MKYLIPIVIFITGCTDKDFCSYSNRFKGFVGTQGKWNCNDIHREHKFDYLKEDIEFYINSYERYRNKDKFTKCIHDIKLISNLMDELIDTQQGPGDIHKEVSDFKKQQMDKCHKSDIADELEITDK